MKKIKMKKRVGVEKKEKRGKNIRWMRMSMGVGSRRKHDRSANCRCHVPWRSSHRMPNWCSIHA